MGQFKPSSTSSLLVKEPCTSFEMTPKQEPLVSRLVVGRQGSPSPGTTSTGSSPMATFINLSKAFLGAASFELPWAVMQGGVIGSTLGIICLALLSYFSLLRLAKCGHMVRGIDRPTYPAVGRAAFGAAGEFMSWFGVVAMTLGVCGSYIDFVTQVGADLVPSLSKEAWLLLLSPVFVGLSWVRSYSVLARTSLFGICALLLAIVTTIIDASTHAAATASSAISSPQQWQAHQPLPQPHQQQQAFPALRLSTYPLFLGNAAYLYLICTAILPLEQAMAGGDGDDHVKSQQPQRRRRRRGGRRRQSTTTPLTSPVAGSCGDDADNADAPFVLLEEGLEAAPPHPHHTHRRPYPAAAVSRSAPVSPLVVIATAAAGSGVPTAAPLASPSLFTPLIGTGPSRQQQRGGNNRGGGGGSGFAGPLAAALAAATVLNILFGVFVYVSYGDCATTATASSTVSATASASASASTAATTLRATPAHPVAAAAAVTCTQSNVVQNLPPGLVTTAVKLLLAVDLLCTTALFLLPLSQALERRLLRLNDDDSNGHSSSSSSSSSSGGGSSGSSHAANAFSSERQQQPPPPSPSKALLGGRHVEAQRNLLRALLVAAIAAVATLAPSFAALSGLSGGFGNNILGFILPPLFYLRLAGRAGRWDGVTPLALRSLDRQAWAAAAELAMCVLVLLFGCAFLLLSTSSFLTLIAATGGGGGGGGSSP